MIIASAKHFFVPAMVLLVAVMAASQAVFSIFLEDCLFPGRLASIVLVGATSCASCRWVMKTAAGRPKAFYRIFMLQTAVKLLVYMGCIVVYLLLFREHGIAFAVHFLVVYTIFSTFEVLMLVKNHGSS
jgi:hypothetical protein